MDYRFSKIIGTLFAVIAMLFSILLFGGVEQSCAQYAPTWPPPQGPPPMGSQPQPNQQPQQPSEYAFRPNLTNPEYGECLNLEKRWRSLWQNYYQLYNQTRMMNPSDPQYAQMANYVNHMKIQLDAAWAEFSGRCVYFPKAR
ncbi:MAG: hypothetical protein V1897_17160 [Pseudomonadota bacterium]